MSTSFIADGKNNRLMVMIKKPNSVPVSFIAGNILYIVGSWKNRLLKQFLLLVMA